MKLYEIPRKSKMILSIGGKDRETKDELCTFHHIDGMYSYITTESGKVVHLRASAEVELKGDHYEIDDTISL